MKKKIAFIIFCMAIAACGKTANNETPQQRIAEACNAEAKVRLGEKQYQLDVAALASSAKPSEDGMVLQAPITIDPGLREEVKQTLECKARVLDGKPVEITYINFIY